MATLKEGILINQPAPRLYRANSRPIYIAIAALTAVFVLLVWAWTVRSNMKAIAKAKALSNTATPATSAIKTLDKQWADKLPKQPELASMAPISPAATQPPELTNPLQPLRPTGMQPYPTNNQAISP